MSEADVIRRLADVQRVQAQIQLTQATIMAAQRDMGDRLRRIEEKQKGNK